MRAIATLAAASALAFAGAVAFAQTTPSAPSAPPASQGRGVGPALDAAPGGSQQRLRWRSTLRDDLTDARIAGIQAGLKLNADQQRLWAPVEQAIRAQAAERIEQRLERLADRRPQGTRQGERLDLMQRLERRAERTDVRAQRVRKRAETLRSLVIAMRPFWASLDEDQKRLLPRLMRSADDRRARRRWDAHHGHHGGMDHGGGSGR